METGLYEYLYFFIIYAFLGWCTEVAYAAVNSGRFVNRGFLNGPMCPIYGTGAVIVIAALTPLMGNKLLLFAGAVVLTSALEWVTGFVLEKCFHGKWWDYSDVPFNLNGYICLKFSLLWGLACLVVMDTIQPLIVKLIEITPPVAGRLVLGLLAALMLADAAATVATIIKLNKRLRAIDEIASKIHEFSDALGENIYETAAAAVSRGEELKEKGESIKEELEIRKNELAVELEAKTAETKRKMEAYAAVAAEFKAKYEAEIGRRSFGHKRLLSAFPGLKSERYGESLEKLKERLALEPADRKAEKERKQEKND